MVDENTNDIMTIEPCLYSRNSIITKVNKEFTDFLGFTTDELIGKSLIDIGDMIRINSQIHLDSINCQYTGYIFTKSLEAREMNISVFYGKEANEQVYTFVEKSNSRLNDKLMFIEQTLIDNISGIAIYSVPDLILLKSNQKNLDFFDFPSNKEENSIGKPLREIVTGFAGTDIERIFNAVIETQKSKYLKQFELNLFARGLTYWDSSKTPIFEDGKMKYLVDNSIEVTENVLKNQNSERQNEMFKQQKKKMERQNIQLEKLLKRQLEEKNIQLISVIENLSEGVILTDHKGKYIMSNSEAGRLIYKSNELNNLGECLNNAKFFDMEGKAIPHENMPAFRALKGEKVKNAKILVKNPDKEYFLDVSSIPIYNTHGDLIMAVSCFYDITETIQQSKKIEEQKKELEAYIENMSNAIAVYNKHGDCTYFNAEARKLYPEIHDQNTRDNVHYGFQYYDLDNHIIPKENLPTMRVFRGEKIRNERIIIKRANKLQITEINGTPIFDDENNLISVIMSHRDITKAINNERHIKDHNSQLLMAEKEKRESLQELIKLKDDFLYMITHELKTPMGVINMALQAIELMCKDEVTETVDKYLKMINQNTNRQLRLVNNLLDITRLSSSEVKVDITNFNMVYVVESIVNSVQLYAEQKNVNLKFTTNLSKKNMYFDEEKIERILLNLLSNALKFTSSGKSISVNLSIKKNKNVNMISISVHDEGIGISEDKQKIIFERFGQADTTLSRQAEGTGLGLYLVKLLVDVLGGEISLKSQVGKGSTFTVLLPEIKPTDEIESGNKVNNKFVGSDRNVIQTAKIEFSDIYF